MDLKMNRKKIVSIGPLANWVIEQFTPEFDLICLGDSDRQAVLDELDDSVIAIIARGPVYIDGEILDKAPNLALIARTGVGYDSVNISEATSRKLPVVYTPGAMTRGVAEHALSLMLAAAKKLQIWSNALQVGDWDVRYTTRSIDLEGAVVGIIGYGRIGRSVRQLLHPFQVQILADDPYIDHSVFIQDDVRFTTLEETLENSDIVTLHVPLTDETANMINSRSLPLMKKGSILVNTARGRVIESLDLLYSSLVSNHLEAVGLDVFPDEPSDPNHPLFKHPRAYCTGHVAARSSHSQKRILETMVAETKAVLEGRTPNLVNVVNPEVFD
jgi:D-3-phosphoglycerate dehydrogenase/(S)-sulfolactate dehydrogenase